MNTEMNIQIAQDHNLQLRSEAGRHAAAARLRSADGGDRGFAPSEHAETIIRLATQADARALGRLAQLEGVDAPIGRVLVAETDGVVLAALGVSGGNAIADPFHPTASLVSQLAEARASLRGESEGRGRFARVRAGLRRMCRPAGSAPRRRAGAPAVPGSESLLIP